MTLADLSPFEREALAARYRDKPFRQRQVAVLELADQGFGDHEIASLVDLPVVLVRRILATRLTR